MAGGKRKAPQRVRRVSSCSRNAKRLRVTVDAVGEDLVVGRDRRNAVAERAETELPVEAVTPAAHVVARRASAAWSVPTLTSAMSVIASPFAVSAAEGVACELVSAEPIPSWPWSFAPQQPAMPNASAQVVLPPALSEETFVRLAEASTSIG